MAPPRHRAIAIVLNYPCVFHDVTSENICTPVNHSAALCPRQTCRCLQPNLHSIAEPASQMADGGRKDMGRIKAEIRGNPVCHGSRVFPREQGSSQRSSVSARRPRSRSTVATFGRIGYGCNGGQHQSGQTAHLRCSMSTLYDGKCIIYTDWGDMGLLWESMGVCHLTGEKAAFIHPFIHYKAFLSPVLIR